MTDVRHLHGLDDESPFEPPDDVPLTVPDRHALNLVKRAVTASHEGDFQGCITELCHAVFVAMFKGPQGVSEHEAIQALRGVAGFGFPWDDPDRAA